ncbi:hypothetical protein D3C81_579910 [compost metagenome]|jgi:hypothetical protein|uniref:hypothetical protein n=1 Tax=Stenotrophomonas TaxID=40323 RepID=UPI000C268B96|nr:hypothetical protein [Stenotrophomonas sp. PA-6-5C]MCF5091804.1 hypothetical protein [Stenotrophomonas sp. PA-6-5C]PJL19864.1 hypothetical protein B9Y66_02040 [Stenotrophomonas maltophilia]CAH0242950.1 hypothetical protein SRABI35_02752 [Stenotrophomonas lactitubi]
MAIRTLRVLAWCSVVLAACVALLSLAPFTPAVILAWPLLVFAAFCIWRGVRLPGVVCAWLASLAFIGSPLSTFDGWNRPIYACWVIAAVLLAVHRLRWARP